MDFSNAGIVGLVVLDEHFFKVSVKGELTLAIQGGEGADGGAVELAEEVDRLRGWERIAQACDATGEAEVFEAGAKPITDGGFVSPAQRGD